MLSVQVHTLTQLLHVHELVYNADMYVGLSVLHVHEHVHVQYVHNPNSLSIVTEQ